MNQFNHMIPMQFEEDHKDSSSIQNNDKLLETKKWRKLHNLILKRDIHFVRKSFKIVNPELYSEVKEIADDIIEKEFSFQAPAEKTFQNCTSSFAHNTESK